MASKFGMWWQKSKLRLWCQKIQQHPFITGGIGVLLLLLIGLIIAVVLFNGIGINGYTMKSTATETTLSSQTKVTTTEQSQPGKTLWDLLQLLIVPLVLAIGGFWLNQIQKDREQRAIDERAEREKRETEQRAKTEREAAEQRDKTERDVALGNQQEAALQAYINAISELLLKEKLRESKPGDEVQKIARVRTLTVLARLDKERKRSLLQFLYESGLIDKGARIIDLSGADLNEANLFAINLSEADLREVRLGGASLASADLTGAELSGADLTGAELSFANLTGAKLTVSGVSWQPKIGSKTENQALLHKASLVSAILISADLSKAFLRRAILSSADLSKADLSEAILSRADLRDANLRDANLRGANLLEAELSGADLTGAMYDTKERQKKDVEGDPVTDKLGDPVMIHETLWPEGFDFKGAGATCVDC
jgi:uncharacterized protein YjbI with pentapeptide repeats